MPFVIFYNMGKAKPLLKKPSLPALKGFHSVKDFLIQGLNSGKREKIKKQIETKSVKKNISPSQSGRYFHLPIFIVLFILLFTAAYFRNIVWENELALWSDVVNT
ncbi:MAG: hypothetical protein HZB79_10685 [Deltaproteobacteria bacterium]|nr:hypothetical protein [Deltaproteobacteria bacterium]